MSVVSVILPTYNRAHYISRAINSILRQSFPDSELIIVDDGSTDNTTDIINFATKKLNIKHKPIWGG